ncbi:ubiquitin-like protein 7, partial [Heliangelus exortis]|uniref:ubiquitin-like protein 7 n=1 Tax=Heliangelus exortis TaxID=472823 RepID=UPI003A8E3F73
VVCGVVTLCHTQRVLLSLSAQTGQGGQDQAPLPQQQGGRTQDLDPQLPPARGEPPEQQGGNGAVVTPSPWADTADAPQVCQAESLHHFGISAWKKRAPESSLPAKETFPPPRGCVFIFLLHHSEAETFSSSLHGSNLLPAGSCSPGEGVSGEWAQHSLRGGGFLFPLLLSRLIPAHPALVNAIILVLHSAGSTPLPAPETSSRAMASSSYRDMPGGFLFEGLSDDEDDFHQSTRSTPSSSTPGSRPVSLGYTGAAGPRPITQSELATALALASTPESSSHTPTPGTQGHSSGTSPMSSSVQSGTPITNDLFSQALQHALQASGQPSLQSQWQPQLQQLRDMGIHDDELSLRALQATGGDIQAALELIFAGGAP